MIAPMTAAKLFEAGEGATVTLPLGGETTGFFEPLTVTGTVRKVRSGLLEIPEHNTREIDMGRTALFEVGPMTMLITELSGVGGNVPEVYEAYGVNPADYKIAVLKTASNFQYFNDISSELIRVDTKGPGQSDIADLPWTNIQRPIYPLDEIASWRNVEPPAQKT